ncbi:MAG: hypothetical protein LC799_23460 [Actinobacteria bacterium]|nr:hypothetical protein [Actinomycetota bacterium]
MRNLLNPASAFFREGRVLVSEEPDLRDVSLYFSVLTALASGHTRRSQLATVLGRKEGALAHPLTVLEEARLIAAQQDALRSRRTTYRVAEPMLRFHQLVIAPREARLSRGRRAQIWDELSGTVNSRILGPHFEELAGSGRVSTSPSTRSVGLPAWSGPPCSTRPPTVASTSWTSWWSRTKLSGQDGCAQSARPRGAPTRSGASSSDGSGDSVACCPCSNNRCASCSSAAPGSSPNCSGRQLRIPTPSSSTWNASTSATDHGRCGWEAQSLVAGDTR